MAAVLSIYFELLPLNRKASWLETWFWAFGRLVDLKWLKLFQSKIKDGRHGCYLENLFWTSPPKQKGPLTQNLVISIGATCKSKKAKKFSIQNSRPWWLSWMRRPTGDGRVNPRRGRQHSFVEIDHEMFSTVILSLPLIKEGQLSVSGLRMCTILVNRLED